MEIAREDSGYVRVVPIVEGLKVFMPSKESCIELEGKLNQLGIKTRSGRNCEIDLWSIYIISVPDRLIGNSYVL